MRVLVSLFLAGWAWWAAPAAAQADRPITPADVVRVEIYYLADGRAIGLEEFTERAPAPPPPIPAAAARAAPRVAAPEPPPLVVMLDQPAPRVAVRIPPATVPAQGVPAPTFRQPVAPAPAPRGPQYNPTHSCPRCGYTSPDGQGTWVKRGPGPVPGSHVHACPRDGTTWWHRDP
jgi:hypothetical protein